VVWKVRLTASFLSAVMLLACSATVLSQSSAAVATASVSGFIADTSGAAVPGANVLLIAKALRGAPESTEEHGQSDATGQFSIQAKPGDYVLEIRARGFLPKRLQLSVEGQSRSLHTVQLDISNEPPCTLPCDPMPLLVPEPDHPVLTAWIEEVPLPALDPIARRFRRHRFGSLFR
jgi:hypothetical protein